ncbi:MAG TPA: hypothetical protein VMV53_00685 [Acidimicrobiales bacterium]|nr:hypothetical protein [Acidimicrobiales bacterium]
MSTQTASRTFNPTNRSGNASLVVRALAVPGALWGAMGGMVLALTMMIVMGAAHMGFASAINIGMPAFVFTITPPLQMLPSLMLGMGINLPSSAMAQLTMAIHSGHISSAMANQLGTMLSSMHVPMAKVQMMGMIMTGHATNATVTSLMSSMTPSARAAVMSAMPLNAGHMAVGLVLHFAFSMFLGLAFFGILGAFAWMAPQALRTRMMFVSAGVIGGAVVYLVMRFGLLPSTNPLMGFVPQIAFFISHLLFGLVVGMGFALAYERRSLENSMPVR